MAERTINEEIEILIKDLANNNPAPQKATITKTYPNKNYVDIQTENGLTQKTVPLIGNNTVGLNGILLYLDGNNKKPIIITSDNTIFQKFGLNQNNADKFNYAIISTKKGEVDYIEFWILANAYYDYTAERFVKINVDSNSFGIQIQAEGSFPGEQELGYVDNTSIGVWRNPRHTQTSKDTDTYDYTDWETKKYIGAKKRSDNTWVEFGISAGWSNNFMLDAFGGMTIGGAGFEIDGSGIFPYTRVTHSIITINDSKYALLGLLDNAYHGSTGCDDNSTYSWFVGLMTPVDAYNVKDNTGTSFVVMYNNTAYDSSDNHSIDNTNWNIVFKVNTGGVVP